MIFFEIPITDQQKWSLKTIKKIVKNLVKSLKIFRFFPGDFLKKRVLTAKISFLRSRTSIEFLNLNRHNEDHLSCCTPLFLPKSS